MVSLLPAATEMLCAIGGRRLLVGRSHRCDYPAGIDAIPAVTAQRTFFQPSAPADGGARGARSSGRALYTLDTDRMRELRPDLILVQDRGPDGPADMETIKGISATLDPPARAVPLRGETLEGMFDDMLAIGLATGLERGAEEAVFRLRDRFFRAADFVNPYTDGPSVAFLEWADPLTVGGGVAPQLVERAGGLHPLNPTTPMDGSGSGAGGQMAHRVAGRSVAVPPAVLAASRPDALILCPRDLPLDAARSAAALLSREPWWGELPAVRAGRVALVDGDQMFHRAGPRLVDAYEWLVGWLNGRPGLIPPGFPWEAWKG